MAFLIESVNEKKIYKANVKLDPIPNNCKECPFFFMPDPNDEGTYFEHWDCLLNGIDDYKGIYLQRPNNCPL